MTVQEIMTRNPACCLPHTTLNQVARMMVEHDCGEIPITDGLGYLKGVVTDRDICCRAVANDCNVCDVKAEQIMSTPVISANIDMSVEECMQLMEDNMIRRIPVVDHEGCCCGIVSQADVACKFDGHVDELLKEVSKPAESASNVS